MAIGLLAAAALGLQAGSSLLGAYGQLQEGDAAYEAGQANAERYRAQASRIRRMTAINTYRQNLYAESVRGAQVAGIAKSGGRQDDPTSQEIFKSTDEAAALDEWLIKYQGIIEAGNYETAANNAYYSGKMAKATSRMGAFSSLLGGAANLYGSYSMLKGK